MDHGLIGTILISILYLFSMHLYKKGLVQKAEAYKTGQSNVEYILGKPYVILKEEDYCEYVKTWNKANK